MKPHVIAHEYAHHVDFERGGICFAEHGRLFEILYKECCFVLGVPYVPTAELVKRVREDILPELEKHNRRGGS